MEEKNEQKTPDRRLERLDTLQMMESQEFDEDWVPTLSCWMKFKSIITRTPPLDYGTFTRKRVVWLNQPEKNKERLYPDNFVKTSKYTLLTFLPKNLTEQFMKAANFYFLIMAIIVSIPGISTIDKWTSILPLVFVLGVTAVKEGMEDYSRHKEDNTTNATKTVVVEDGKLVERQWKDIAVGDVVKIRSGEHLPCDLVLLSSSDPRGNCCMQTANLDGETTLKKRHALPVTLPLNNPEAISACRSKILVGIPDPKLHFFEGVWFNEEDADVSKAGKDQTAVTSDQLLLRGANLQETEFAFALVVFTGAQTKVVLNSNPPRHKRTNVEKIMNKQMYLIFIMQFFIVSILTLLSALWRKENIEDMWYLHIESESNSEFAKITARNFFAFYILLSVMVPISLYVSMELVKVAQALLIWVDIEMYDDERNMRAVPRTSDLNEELGQIQYIFSDKTGTLTQNKMAFYKCSVLGHAFGLDVDEFGVPISAAKKERNSQLKLNRKESHSMSRAGVETDLKVEDAHGDLEEFDEEFRREITRMQTMHAVQADHSLSGSKFIDPSFDLHLQAGTDLSAAMRRFLESIVVCNNVNPHKEDEILTYNGASIDEVALVTGAQALGFVLKERDEHEGTIVVDFREEKDLKYEILNVMEFTSERARMSVLARGPDGQVILFTKGSDQQMLARLDKNLPEHQEDAELMVATKDHLNQLSEEGLRTLVMGWREISNEEYSSWLHQYTMASQAIGDRKSKLEKVSEQIEHSLRLLAVTAIEDALQIGVPSTLKKLRAAGMKVWMLTGDKRETAVNIGFTCGLASRDMTLRFVLGSSKNEVKKNLEGHESWLDALKDEPPASEDGCPMRAIPAADRGKVVPLEMGSGGDFGQFAPQLDQQEEPKSGKAALVIDGPSLVFCLHPTNTDLFLRVINHPRSRVVICSRMAPAQKAAVVELVKSQLGAITLAIGDGANDVSMIQAAHVGVGIRGKEGLNAVNNSDYAITRFRYLARLLLVHGRLSYKRTAKLILYSFYKNMMMSFTQVWFCMESAYSGEEIYDGFLLSTYNLFYTSMPILAVACLERDLDPVELMKWPFIYLGGIKNKGFNLKLFWTWAGSGVAHSVVCFYLSWYTLAPLGLWGQSVGTYVIVVFAATAKICIITTTWTWINHVFTWCSLGVLFAFVFLGTSKVFLDWFPNLYNTLTMVCEEPTFWLALILVCAIVIVGDMAWMAYTRAWAPTHKHIIQERRNLESEANAEDAVV